MLKIIIRIILALMILGTIKMIKKGKLIVPIENYIISIVIYTVIIMLLF